MVKPSDIPKLTSTNYWTWKPDAEALLMAEGLFDTVDPNQAVPAGVVQLRKWTENNAKVYGLLYLALDDPVKTKVNNANVQRSGRLLWGTLESIFTTPDPSNRALLMTRFNGLTHDLSKPADTFLQAVVTAERNLAAIAVSLPTFTVQDKILNGLSSVYSPITAILQNESPQRDIPSMINAINNWESTDLQKTDSLIQAAHLFNASSLGSNPGSVGAEDPTAFAARDRPHRSHPHSHSRSASTPAYDWTNTKNRTDVCYRCGLPGHFAQYCVSEMPDDVRRRIIRERKEKASVAVDSDNDSDAEHVHFAAQDHFAAAALDLPTELNLNMMDHETLVGFTNSLPNTITIPPISVADLEAGHTDKLHTALLAHIQVQHSSSPSVADTATPIILSAASTPVSTPSKKKKKKKSKKVPTSPPPVSAVQTAMHGLALMDDEGEYSM
ncbi:hypothetical protein MSAN_00885700 [Mycena sanguinolenta]|uniref:CCHC-type domain-containing protein n=1 Tax=Mycena sanguinolenta TaxID=230812 RepID=A0A8H7D9I2_9AGAR|nr:hypothetical protein MSAN_00885700 [Mycena sanguinolenta]